MQLIPFPFWFVLVCGFLVVACFGDRISCSLGWPQIPYVTENDFELTLLPPPLKGGGCRPVPSDLAPSAVCCFEAGSWLCSLGQPQIHDRLSSVSQVLGL